MTKNIPKEFLLKIQDMFNQARRSLSVNYMCKLCIKTLYARVMRTSTSWWCSPLVNTVESVMADVNKLVVKAVNELSSLNLRGLAPDKLVQQIGCDTFLFTHDIETSASKLLSHTLTHSQLTASCGLHIQLWWWWNNMMDRLMNHYQCSSVMPWDHRNKRKQAA